MTYDQLLQQISAAGQNWSPWDLETAQKNPAFGASMFTYKNDYATAKDAAGKKAANQGAEALRRQYGSYLGGSDGSKYYGLGGPASYEAKEYQGSEAGSAISGILGQMKNYGSFSYDQPKPEYNNSYQNLIGSLMGQVQGYGDFSYGPKPEYMNQYQQQIADALGKVQNYGDFSYGPKPEYSNQYQQQIADLLGQVQGYGPFSWNKDQDPAYSAYAKQYRREGDRATANALAQAAAATGGQVSTAAMTAATQAGDYYAGQLADKIPELYENAYQRYLSDYKLLADKLGQTQQAEQYDYAKYLSELGQYNTDRNQAYSEYLNKYNMLTDQLGQFRQLEQDDYAKYRDQLGQYNTDRNQAYSEYLNKYNMLTDKLGQAQQAEQYDYAKYLDQLNQFNTDRNLAYNEFNSGFDRLNTVLGGLQGQDDREYNRFMAKDQTDYARFLDQLNYTQAQDEAARARQEADKSLYQKQVDAILSAGGTPSAELLGQSGYSGEYASALQNYYQQKLAAAAAKSSGGSSGGRSSGGKTSGGDESGSIYQQLYGSGIRSEGDAYAALVAMDYNTTQAGKLAKYFSEWMENYEDSGSSGGVTVDMQSVLNLGYGPLDDAALDRLVSSGEVEEYQEGNKIKFRRTGGSGQSVGLNGFGLAWKR